MSHLTAAHAIEDRIALARHFDAMGGWLTASYFHCGAMGEIIAKNAMVVAEHLVAGNRGRVATFELTDAGRAWYAEQTA